MNYLPVVPTDAEEVSHLLLDERWPGHVPKESDRAAVLDRVAAGACWSDHTRAFWIVTDANERAGIVELRNLDQSSPTFELWLRWAHRLHVARATVVRWLTEYLFTEFPAIARIEARMPHGDELREDLERCGWVQEAHYRLAMRSEYGDWLYDTVGYAMLRRDWERGTTTPVLLPNARYEWNEESLRALRAGRELLDIECLVVAARLAAHDGSLRNIAANLEMPLRKVGKLVERLNSIGLIRSEMIDDEMWYALETDRLSGFSDRLEEVEQPRSRSVNIHDDPEDLRGIVEKGMLLVLPRKHEKRMRALAWLAGKFSRSRDYAEQEVNAIITRHHPDYCTMRRALVEYGFMTRAEGIYRRTDASA